MLPESVSKMEIDLEDRYCWNVADAMHIVQCIALHPESVEKKMVPETGLWLLVHDAALLPESEIRERILVPETVNRCNIVL